MVKSTLPILEIFLEEKFKRYEMINTERHQVGNITQHVIGTCICSYVRVLMLAECILLHVAT